MRICPQCGARTDRESCPADGRVTIDEALLERSDRLVGRVLAGRYAIEARLGAGAMGSVYRARHRETGGLVAVKVLRGEVAETPDLIKRFHIEAQNGAMLRHPNTVRVSDFGAEEDLLFLVMEHLDGRPLSEVIATEGQEIGRASCRERV